MPNTSTSGWERRRRVPSATYVSFDVVVRRAVWIYTLLELPVRLNLVQQFCF
jgi:hypothetical protein